MQSDFAQRFRIALNALSMSRGRCASEMGVDKSLVGRWASGTGGPSASNRERLTRLLATKCPGFTLLDWDREIEDFAALFGVAVPGAVERTGDAFHASLLEIAQPSMDANVAAYEGFWRTTHASLFEQGQFCQQHGLIRRTSTGALEFEGGADGIRYRGAMFPVGGQLFALGGDDVRNIPSLMILNVMAVPKVLLMDGLVLTASSPLRIPTAYPVVFERVGDLSHDRATDNARMAQLVDRPEVVEDPALVAAVVRKHLLRDDGHGAARGSDEVALTAPLSPQLAQMIALSRRAP